MKISKRSSTAGGTGSDDQNGAVPDSEAQYSESSKEVVVAQTENPAQPGLALPDNAINLVPYLLEAAEKDEKVKKFIEETLPNQVMRHFDEDWKAREGWMQQRATITNLFLGALKEKSEPFRNCANMHVPILATRILRLVSRVWAELHAKGQPMFSAQAGSKLSEKRADLITKHENWQFEKEIPDFPAHTWRYWMDFFLFGEGIFSSTRDFLQGKNRHRYVSPDKFVYPYVEGSTAPDMSDVPRKTEILSLYKRDLKSMERLGFYAQVSKVCSHRGTHDTDLDQPVKDAVDKFEKRDRTDHTEDAPYELLEQHTWVQLPYADQEEPYRVVVDRKSKAVLGLYSRYYDDPEDRTRFDRETSEFEQYMLAVQQYTQIIEEEQKTLAVLQQPNVPPEEAIAIGEQVQRERPNPPMSPPWMKPDEEGNPKPPEPCKQKVIEWFSRGTCIDIPNNSFGIGLGVLMLPHQMAGNIMLNQYIDAGTLANSLGLVVHDMVKFPPGMTSISPNEITRIRGVPPDQIEKAFWKFDHQQANPQLLQGVQMQEAAADGISSSPDVLSGQKEGDETFRGQATRVEQSTKQLSALTVRGMVALNQVATNNAMLNFQFLPDTRQVDARDPATRKLTPITVTRELYRDSYDVVFSADLSFASRATKVSEADDAMGLLMKGVPPQLLTLVMRPEGVGAALRKCLQARDMFDLASYMLTDDEIGQRMMAQQQASQAGAPPGAPPPSVPNGQAPGPAQGAPPQPHIARGTPAEAAPGGVQ